MAKNDLQSEVAALAEALSSDTITELIEAREAAADPAASPEEAAAYAAETARLDLVMRRNWARLCDLLRYASKTDFIVPVRKRASAELDALLCEVESHLLVPCRASVSVDDDSADFDFDPERFARLFFIVSAAVGRDTDGFSVDLSAGGDSVIFRFSSKKAVDKKTLEILNSAAKYDSLTPGITLSDPRLPYIYASAVAGAHGGSLLFEKVAGGMTATVTIPRRRHVRQTTLDGNISFGPSLSRLADEEFCEE